MRVSHLIAYLYTYGMYAQRNITLLLLTYYIPLMQVFLAISTVITILSREIR